TFRCDPGGALLGGGAMRDGREALSTLGVALAAVAIQLPIYDRHLALLDEGYLLALAEEIARGKLLYRDVYVDNPFPGAFYLAILLAPERTGKVRRALAFAGSAALVVAPALLSFAAHGALRPFFDQTVVRPLRAAATSRYLGLPPLLPLLHQDAALRAGIGSY